MKSIECDSNNTQIYGLIQDFEALLHCLGSSPVVDDLKLMSTFLRTKRHLLQLQDPTWGLDRIFHQLALEHADESSLTQRVERWLKENQPEWSYWRRKRRTDEVPVNPCIQTPNKRREWSVIEEWQDLMVAYDCCSYLWVGTVRPTRSHVEITGYVVDQENRCCMLKAFIYGKFDDDNQSPPFQMESEFIATVLLSTQEVLITTKQNHSAISTIRTCRDYSVDDTTASPKIRQ